jgi:hypothetical protein
MDGAQLYQGFAVELNLGSRLVGFTTGTGNSDSLTSFGGLQGGFMLGYKISRVTVGLGLELTRVAVGSGGTNMSDTSSADTAFELVPGVRVAIFRSPEKRVEMYGALDIGLGTTAHEQSTGGNATPSSRTLLVTYRIGPGVRFWAHPQFALGGLVGVEGDFVFQRMGDTGMTMTTSTGLTSIFGQLQLLGVF